MIKRIGIGAAAFLFIGMALADGTRTEVGYVESFAPSAAHIMLVRNQVVVPVAILTPVMQDDIVEISDPKAMLVLRLVDRPDPVVLSSANKDYHVDAKPPEKSFWSGLFTWTGGTVDVFDKEQRQQVMASIRDSGKKDLSAPMLSIPQTVAAGTRMLTVGWSTPKAVDIRILARTGKPVASGRGIGGLWTTPSMAWKPGSYRIELQDGDNIIGQLMQVVPAANMPVLPAELQRPDIPAELRQSTTAALYAANGPQYLLEGLQSVAADARTSRSARLLTLALIDGKRPASLPP